MPEKKTFALDVPGAVLTDDVREAQTPTDEPPIVMIGSPMGAKGFTTLAAHFTDRTIVTYYPRGVERSTVSDTSAPATPSTHADDVHRLIRELSTGPVDLFASSGGAVNALALVDKHPTDARTLVAHEPPLEDLLPDREELRTAMRDVHETYLAKGFGHGMAKFIRLVTHQGEFTDDYLAQPDPDPAMFGPPAEVFPGGHNGFMGGEYGQPVGRPVEFAAKLRTFLGRRCRVGYAASPGTARDPAGCRGRGGQGARVRRAEVSWRGRSCSGSGRDDDRTAQPAGDTVTT